MGSTGSGSFGNYRFGKDGFGNGTGGGTGGDAGEFRCPAKVENIRLEDVATSQYYLKHISLPQRGTDVILDGKLNMGRLVVRVVSTGEILGNLPTQYNYLYHCIAQGINYSGTVIGVGVSPIPYAVVTLYE